MVTKHIEKRGDTEHRAKQIGALRKGSPDQKPGVRAAENRKFFGNRPVVGDKPFGGAEEIVESDLAGSAPTGFVPVRTEFRSPSNVGKGEQTAALHEARDENAKLRRSKDSETAVGGHDHRVATFLEEHDAAY